VAAWLICHVLAFSALLPRDCCAAHAHSGAAPLSEAAAAADHSAHLAVDPHAHHEAPLPAGTACPMAAADGAPCPMHDGAAPGGAACRMTGVCNQPAAALAAVLMQAAVPAAIFAFQPLDLTAPVVVTADASPHALVLPPDSPPPRL
jgi:hypothetical protein